MDGNARLGGPSRRVGGSRDERPPQSSSPNAVASVAAAASPPSTKRWVPPSVVNKSFGPYTTERNDIVFRKVRGILNKLTPEKFDKLSLELLNVGIDSQIILKGIILLIFEKALDEPKYSTLYAQLCHRLFRDAPNFEPPDSNITTFRRLLLSKCQDEFENRSRATEAFEKDGPLSAEESEQCCIAKAKMLGNIKFIGELGKLGMLQEGILHKCIKQLVERKKLASGGASRVADMSEDMECLCEILRTVGQRLDHDRARSWMDQYFERIGVYQQSADLPARIRFLLQDIIELRANNWQPRKIQIAAGAPKTIQQVREEAAKDSGIFIPKPAVLSPSYLMTDPFFGPPLAPRAVNGGHAAGSGGQRSGTGATGLSDMFGSGPSMYMGGLGTGPGVIPIDHFAKANQQMNRQRAMGGGGMNQGYDSMGGGRRQDGGSKGDKIYREHRDFGEIGGGGGGRLAASHSDEDDERSHYTGSRGSGGRSYYRDEEYNGGGGQHRDGHRGGGGRGVGGGRDDRQNDKQNFQKTAAPAAGRELPPRFQRKQAQHMHPKDSAFPDDADRSISPPNYQSGGATVSPYQPGTYTPMMPPTILGGTPVTTTGSGATSVPTKSSLSSDDVSLRPARNFAPVLKPNTPATLPKSAQSSHPPSRMQPQPMVSLGPSVPAGPLVQKQITVIQVPSLDKNRDKNNKHQNAGLNREELKQAVENLLATFLESQNVDVAVDSLASLKPPKKFIPELLASMMTETMDKPEDDHDRVMQLISALKDKNLINSDNFMEVFDDLALGTILEKLPNFEAANPLAKSFVARFAAGAVSGGVISLAELASPLTGGHHYPLFLLCLQQLGKLRDRDWTTKTFADSKVNLRLMLPELELNKGRLMEILEDRGLGFLMPLLRVQADLTKQLQADPSPANFLKWVRDNVDSKLFSDPGFITILITTVIEYITSMSTLREGVDVTVNPEKPLVEQEKEMLEKFKGVLQKFLLNKIPLHVTAIYALQVFSLNKSSPKGLLLRMFMNLYNFEVIDEEAFMLWKEEVNDVHPGKGQALFQVNQWLTWLEQAEEESDEDED